MADMERGQQQWWTMPGLRSAGEGSFTRSGCTTLATTMVAAFLIASMSGCTPKPAAKTWGEDFRSYNRVTTKAYHTPMDAVPHKDTWHQVWVNDVGLA